MTQMGGGDVATPVPHPALRDGMGHAGGSVTGGMALLSSIGRTGVGRVVGDCRLTSRGWGAAGGLGRRGVEPDIIVSAGREVRAELSAIRASIRRGATLRLDAWVHRIAGRLGLESSLNPRGRPRKEPEKSNAPFCPLTMSETTKVSVHPL